MIDYTIVIPPAACWHRVRGEVQVRRNGHTGPEAVLFDRDDTLTVDVPYLSDPALVRQAALALDVDVRRCVVIGDTEADRLAARQAGARGILVPSGRTLPVEVLRARQQRCLARDIRTALVMAGAR